MKSDKIRWTLGRLVDLEFFLRENPLTAEQITGWYAREVRNTGWDRTDSQRLLKWVEHCREAVPDSPGRWLTRIGRVLYAVALILLFLSGIGVARSVLQFDGQIPINLFTAFGVLVVVPLTLSVIALAVLAGSLCFAKSPGTAWGKDVRRKLILLTVVPLIERIHRGPDWIRSARRWVETLWSRSGLYAKATGWTGFSALQACGLVFGVGLYVGTVFKGAVEDLNFGWSTTSRLVTVERVDTTARAVATPWSWISAEWTVPSLDDVAGSQYVKRQGVRDLDTQSLQSWFPFLSAAVFVYAVLPRLLLLLLGVVCGRLAFRRLVFKDADCQSLLRRMKGTTIRISGSAAEPVPQWTAVVPSDVAAGAAVMALVHDEVSVAVSRDWIRNALSRAIGDVVDCAEVELDVDADRDVVSSQPEVTLALVVAGWRPCLEQTKDYIRWLRKSGGAQRLLVIALIGKPVGGSFPEPLSAEWLSSWKESIADLRDPYLDVMNLSGAHESG